MAGGRPRTVSLSPEQMIELGEEMVEWINNNPDTLHLTQWWSIHKFFTEDQWDVMKDAPEFSPYYKKALHLIGIKYLSKDSKVRDNISPRWQRVYFKDLRKSEDADLDAEAERSRKVEAKDVEDMNLKFDVSMNQVLELLSNRNIDESNTSNETKS